MSERSQTVPTPEGEYFESSRFTGLSFLLGLIALVALALSVVGAFVNPHQFSYSWLFAFAFFSSCHRRRMVGSCAASVGKHCGIAGGPGAAFRANSPPPPSSLRMDGHSAWTRGFA